jgi:hypothetical protein
VTTSEFVSNVVLLSEGKLPTFASGSTKWLRIVAQGNFWLQQFAKERGIDWNWYYDPIKSFGAVTATATFAIPSTVQKISQKEGDTIRIVHTDSRYTDYALVAHDQLKRYDTGNYAARIGSNIKFNQAFTATSQQFGGTIYVPVYEYPSTFSADGDDIDHPDANWLVFTVAADRVKNDVTRKDLRDDLISQANESMLTIREDNEGQIDEVNRPWNPTANTNTGDYFGGQ